MWQAMGRIGPVLGPVALGVVQVGGTFGAANNQPDARAPDAFAVVLALVGPLLLLLIASRTRLLLLIISASTFTYVAVGYPYGPVFASFAIAVAIAASRGERLFAWAAVAAAVVLSVVIRTTLLDRDWSWTMLGGALAWGLVVVGVGELVRLNRARAAEARRARVEEKRREAGEERLRIARELHDVVAHHMSLINVQAGVALHLVERRTEPDGTGQVETALATIKDASKEALTELRGLIGILRADEAAPRAPVSGLSALDELVRRTTQTGITTTADVRGDLSTVPPPVDLAAFRIIQEAITNVVRHSGAARTHIEIDVGSLLTVRVSDDGRGPGDVDGGTGLRGMRERAIAFSGDVTLRPGPRGGAVLTATLDLTRAPLTPEPGTPTSNGECP